MLVGTSQCRNAMIIRAASRAGRTVAGTYRADGAFSPADTARRHSGNNASHCIVAAWMRTTRRLFLLSGGAHRSMSRCACPDSTLRRCRLRTNRSADDIASAQALGRERQSAHVQAHPDRQSRRNRLPDHQDRAADGDRDGRGLFRRRPRRAACRDGRRGGPDRPAAGGRKLSGDRQDRRRLPQDRRRGGASGLRLSVRARGLSQGARRGRHRLHRAQSRGDRGDGRQDRKQEGGGRRQGLDRARPSRRDRR